MPARHESTGSPHEGRDGSRAALRQVPNRRQLRAGQDDGVEGVQAAKEHCLGRGEAFRVAVWTGANDGFFLCFFLVAMFVF